MKDQIIEELARAWASIDGKRDEFDGCKRDANLEESLGHYEGYLSEAAELIKQSPTLSALLDRASELDIKDLEWTKAHDWYFANTKLGNYAVWVIGGNCYLRYPGGNGGTVVGKTIEDGKSAAVIDMKEKIKEMLKDG